MSLNPKRPRISGSIVRFPISPARIAIHGYLPPLYGGVSVHLQRLLPFLDQSGYSYSFYDQNGQCDPSRNIYATYKTPLSYLRFLATVPEKIVHFNVGSPWSLVPAVSILKIRRKSVVWTVHSMAPHRTYLAAPPALRLILRQTLRRCDKIVAVNEEIATWLCDIGCLPTRVLVKAAFLPPSSDELADTHLDPLITKFVANHSPVIGVHGYFGYYLSGKDVYGIDLLADFLEMIKKEFSNAGLYTVISGSRDESHRRRIFEERARRKLVNDWMIIESNFPACAIYKLTDVFIRPTQTDGDSMSVRECIYLGVPVIASDCVGRPEACDLFVTGDVYDLARKVLDVLGNRSPQQPAQRQNPETYIPFELDMIYRGL